MNPFNSAATLGTNGFEVSLNYFTGIPDVNTLSDPNLKKNFRSLLKKDETTKEKALKEIINSSDVRIFEDYTAAVAWVQIYPKLSIDLSRNVRLLAHQLQTKIVHTLGKKYSRFLADTIGAWIIGTYDTERVVSSQVKTEFLSCFNEEKFESLFTIFQVPLLNFVNQLVNSETQDSLSNEQQVSKDEAQLKFNRAITSSTQMFQRVLQLPNHSKESVELIETITGSHSLLWDNFSSKDLNIRRHTLQTVPVLLSYSEKLLKPLTKAVFKSCRKINKKQVLLNSTIILPTLNALYRLAAQCNNVWTFSKNSQDHFIEFISLGSCNCDPVYYRLLSEIITLSDDSFISIENDVFFTTITDIIYRSISKERQNSSVIAGWVTFLDLILKFKVAEDLIIKTVTPFIVSLLNKSKLDSAIVKKASNFFVALPSDELLLTINDLVLDSFVGKKIIFGEEPLNAEFFLNNYFNVLASEPNSLSECLSMLCSNALNSLEDEELDLDEKPTNSLVLVEGIISHDFTEYSNEVKSFLFGLLSFLDVNFVKQPLRTLALYSESELFDDKVLHEVINDFFVKLEDINDSLLIAYFLKRIPQIKHFDIAKCPNLVSFTLKKSGQSFTENDSAVIFKLLTKDVLKNLYGQALNSSKDWEGFIANCCSQYQNDLFLKFVLEEPQFLVNLWKRFPSSNELLNLIETNNSTNPEFIVEFKQSLLSFLLQASFEDFKNVPEILAHILQAENGPEMLALPDAKLLAYLTNGVKFSSYQTILSNPLQHNVALFKIDDFDSGDSSTSIYSISAVISYVLFLLKNNFIADEMHIKVLAVLAEAVVDHTFLSPDPEIDLVDLHSNSVNYLLGSTKDLTTEDVLNVISDANSESVLSSLLKEAEKNIFVARITARILSNKLQYSKPPMFSPSFFNDLYKRGLPVLSVVLISLPQEVLFATELDRFRNQIASYLVGIRNSKEILSSGLPHLTLLNNFTLLERETFSSSGIIEASRSMMVLQSFSKLLESDIAYDQEFIPMRIQMLIFLHNCLSKKLINSDGLALAYEILSNLVRDSLGVVSMELESATATEVTKGMSTALAYYTLRSLILLQKFSEVNNDSWMSEKETIITEFLAVVKVFNFKVENLCTELVLNLVQQVLLDIVPDSSLNEEIDFFYEQLTTSFSILMLKVATQVLYKVLFNNHQNFVIEMELQKMSIKADEDTPELKPELPPFLIQLITTPFEEYIEFESQEVVARYLFGWYLVLLHFRNVTYDIRRSYIRQVEDYLSKFLSFVFLQIDFEHDKSFYQLLKSNTQVDRPMIFDKFSSDLPMDAQFKTFTVHLYYTALELLGSSCKHWFMDIKNRQLKSTIEEVTKTLISPILINSELDAVDKRLKSSEVLTKDENLKVKTNRQQHDVKSQYTIDEQTMEMTIRLPDTYPLTNVVVEGLHRIGVKEQQWRAWLNSCQRVISSSNGTIIEALELFNKNVNYHFSGFEECAVCYSILHLDSSLPSQSCHTCNNKFHSGCLYKWFKSSGTSTCPLCRSTFNFSRRKLDTERSREQF
ncbi:BA75_04230T0 [Komagataella pastoris]|uniref:E3 ubiquitin-protein ligase listerin n=1 Tax=Komagataella pastoris TaxID=4922 RepID=A0A1B2JGM1_PICPA|nr:BA75_04230T0 [Komagataella pastoris]